MKPITKYLKASYWTLGYIMCVLSFISFTNADEVLSRKMIDGETIGSVPVEYQENFIGRIVLVGENVDRINLMFSGKVRMFISGNQVGGYLPSAKQYFVEIDVISLPIVIRSDNVRKDWRVGDANWKAVLQELKRKRDSGNTVKATAGLLKPSFSGRGDLLMIECIQFAILPEGKVPEGQRGRKGQSESAGENR